MTVVFDAEPLVAFAFDEPGATTVEQRLDGVYDGECDGYVSTINLAEFRYIATRRASKEQADSYITDLRDMGLSEYPIDKLWKPASSLKATYNTSIADAYAVAAANDLDTDSERVVTLLVGGDDDYDVFETEAAFEHLIERFRDGPA